MPSPPRRPRPSRSTPPVIAPAEVDPAAGPGRRRLPRRRPRHPHRPPSPAPPPTAEPNRVRPRKPAVAVLPRRRRQPRDAEGRMTLKEHLRELRHRMFVSAAADRRREHRRLGLLRPDLRLPAPSRRRRGRTSSRPRGRTSASASSAGVGSAFGLQLKLVGLRRPRPRVTGVAVPAVALRDAGPAQARAAVGLRLPRGGRPVVLPRHRCSPTGRCPRVSGCCSASPRTRPATSSRSTTTSPSSCGCACSSGSASCCPSC